MMGLLVDQELEACAIEKYAKDRLLYNQILNDALPASWRKWSADVDQCAAYNAGTNATAADDWPAFHFKLEHHQFRDAQLRGYPTGLASLDFATLGTRGTVLVAGAPGVGKTSLATNLVVNALRSDPELGVLVYYLENPKDDFYRKLMCYTAGISSDVLFGELSNQQKRKLKDAETILRPITQRIKVVEFHAVRFTGLDAGRINGDWQALQRASDVRRPLIVIDSLRKIPPPAPMDDVPVDADLHRLRMLQEFESTRANVIITCGMRKDHRRATIEDVLGPAELGYLADQVWILTPSGQRTGVDSQPTTIRVVKCRGGMTQDLPTNFRFKQFKFFDASIKHKSRPTRKRSINPLAGS